MREADKTSFIILRRKEGKEGESGKKGRKKEGRTIMSQRQYGIAIQSMH